VADRHPDHDLLAELEPVAEQLLDRHLSMAKEWLPHEYIPWSLGRDFDTEPWTPDQPRLTGVAQAAFEVNLLTEDNLPSYHHQLLASFGRDWAWRTWSHRWTAEEGRHAGVGIQGFTRKALQMAQAGIYDLRIHHDEILWPAAAPLGPVRPRRPGPAGRAGAGSARHPPGQDRPTRQPIRGQTSRHRRQRTQRGRLNRRIKQPTATTVGAAGPGGATPGLTGHPIARATAVPVGRDATPSSGNVRTGISPPRQPAAGSR
jgi:hypothetical protein